MEEESVGCGRPTGAILGESVSKGQKQEQILETKEAKMAAVSVGGKAPDFEAPAFYKGKFVKIKLSDYLGKWIVICFYPGDFTFV